MTVISLWSSGRNGSLNSLTLSNRSISPMEKISAMRAAMAMMMPSVRARSSCPLGARLAITAMNTTLSMPSTTPIKDTVSSDKIAGTVSNPLSERKSESISKDMA